MYLEEAKSWTEMTGSAGIGSTRMMALFSNTVRRRGGSCTAGAKSAIDAMRDRIGTSLYSDGLWLAFSAWGLAVMMTRYEGDASDSRMEKSKLHRNARGYFAVLPNIRRMEITSTKFEILVITCWRWAVSVTSIVDRKRTRLN